MTKRTSLAIALLLCGGFLATLRMFAVEAHAGSAPARAADAWIGDLAPIDAAEWNYACAARLLDRAGFGGTPAEIERLVKLGPEGAVDSLLDYESIDDSALPPFQESGIYPAEQDQQTLAVMARKAIARDRDAELMKARIDAQFYQLAEEVEIGRLMEWWADRMVRTPRPFQEKMTLFWHGHFATSNDKVKDYRKYLRQLSFFRDHATANFRDLLLGIAKDPAMLVYLDNKDNRKGGPNENFSREVMELYTLGVGNYSESDVKELARAFTGWTFRGALTADEATSMTRAGEMSGAAMATMGGRGEAAGEPGMNDFVIVPTRHDDGVKEFLGQRGAWDGEDAIDILLRQDAAAPFISAKLYRFFVREEISPEMKSQLAARMREGNFAIKPFVRTLLLSKDFYSPPSHGALVKGPVQLLVSTYRRMGLREAPTVPDFRTATKTLGQELFYPPNVAGWRGGRAWITPASILERGNLMYESLFSGAPRGSRRAMKAMVPGSDGRIETAGLTPEERKAFIENFARNGNQLTIGKEDKFESENILADLAQARTEAKKRVRDLIVPTLRFGPDLEVATMLKEAEVSTCGEAVDALIARFSSVAPTRQGRDQLVADIERRLGGKSLDYGVDATETALRHTLYEILSSTAYQLM